jgi:hypothetical protein
MQINAKVGVINAKFCAQIPYRRHRQDSPGNAMIVPIKHVTTALTAGCLCAATGLVVSGAS